jgi:hypothetical protein
MKLSKEAEKYADTLFFNESRTIFLSTQKALRERNFVSPQDTAQADYSLQVDAAAKMAKARMRSYVTAYESEGETVEHEDVLDFIRAAKATIDRQSKLISTAAGGTITMIRNEWSAEYRDQMLTYFRDKAFQLIEPDINELILKSNETPFKKAARRKMNKRTELFRWILEQCGRRQYSLADLRIFLKMNSTWSEDDVYSASNYLEGDGLIEQKDDSGLLVWLTHEGVKAGEAASEVGVPKQKPVIQHTQTNNTFHGPVGAFQQGDNNVSNVAQTMGANMDEVVDLLSRLREQIEPEHQELGMEYIDALEEELKKSTPKESRVRLFLKGAGGFANEAGKAVVGELAKKLLSGDPLI